MRWKADHGAMFFQVTECDEAGEANSHFLDYIFGVLGRKNQLDDVS